MAGHDEYAESSKRSTQLMDAVPPLLFTIAVLVAITSCLAQGTTNLGPLRALASTLATLAEKNHILQAFVASSVLGLISYMVMVVSRAIVSRIRGRWFCSVSISNRDENFGKVLEYIAKQGIVQSGCLVASTHKKNKTWKDWRTEFLMGERKAPEMEYQPANNNDVHVITYRGHRILMHRAKGDTVVAGWERVPTEMETLTLSSYGSDVRPLKALIDDAVAASFDEQRDELSIFVQADSWISGWEKALSKKPRPIESVILDEDLASQLLADARGFLDAAEWYSSVGIPYRRGYLLHGPPGCGKTSFCQALAGALRLDICMLTLTNKRLNDNTLAASLRDAPPNAIILLEDVDAVFVDRAASKEHDGAGVTFSGLLNALDGVASQEGRLFFMTTNHLEKLDAALVRPGRCDVKVEVRKASRRQAERLFRRFFGGAPDADARAFADALPEHELSMAALQGYLLEHKGDAALALRHVPRLLRASKPLHVDSMPVVEHLRRVGLEGWAALFHYHGYHLRADLHGLTIETVRGWSGYLRIDTRACRRMEMLLAQNDDLMADYQLIDMATAKDLFLAAFAGAAAGGHRAGKSSPAATSPSTASRSSSSSSLDVARGGGGEDGSPIAAAAAAALTAPSPRGERPPLSQLADRLCDAIQRDGKSCVSIWQVRRHLRLHAHSAEAAVAAAAALVAPPSTCGVDALAIDGLGTYDWLRRAGLERHAAALEDAGYASARSLYTLKESVLEETCGVKDASERAALAGLVAADAAGHARALVRFTSADLPFLRATFLAAFEPAAEPATASTGSAWSLEAHADEFAAMLADDAGRGIVSIGQVERCLERSRGMAPADAIAAARAELLEHARPPPPPAAEEAPPTEWVYGWLDGHGLAKYAAALLEHNFATRDDLTLPPRLTLHELETKLGVDKAADARKLLKLIGEL